MKILRKLEPVVHPQLNGMVERHYRTVCQYMSMLIEETQKDWDKTVHPS